MSAKQGQKRDRGTKTDKKKKKKQKGGSTKS